PSAPPPPPAPPTTPRKWSAAPRKCCATALPSRCPAGNWIIDMLFLAIETSCDETAAAVFSDEPKVLANIIASQTDLHRRFGGVVPEVAARAHVRQLLPVI